jgi:hypothetical protein
MPKAKIEQCLSLIEKAQVSRAYFPPVYQEVVFAYADLEDYDRAAGFTRMQIKIASENMKAEFASGKLSALGRETWPKRMSYHYRTLGKLLALARLKGSEDGSEKALSYVKAELSSYNAAIAYDREDHESYMERAEVQSLLCNDSEASTDWQTALRIAQLRDDRAYRDYKFKTLPRCVSAWRSK